MRHTPSRLAALVLVASLPVVADAQPPRRPPARPQPARPQPPPREPREPREQRAPRRVGQVECVAVRRDSVVEASTRGEHWQRTGPLRSPIRRRAPLTTADLVRIHQRLFVDLRFASDTAPGACGPRRDAATTRAVLGSRELSEVGSYEIREDTVAGIGGLQLTVRQGVMVIDHAGGALSAVALGLRTRIFGTTVLVAVDSAGGSGTLYLHDGRIDFPDHGIAASGRDRAWLIRPNGLPPQELSLTRGQRDRLRDEVDFTTERVWRSTPFWQRRWFQVTSLAVGVGVGTYIAVDRLRGNGGPGSASGDVVITIPQ